MISEVTVPVFVGLDYHYNSVQVCVVDSEGRQVGNRSCENDWLSIVEEAHRHGTVRRAALESCAGAADLAEQLVSLAGWSVDLAHPGYVQRMKQNPDKTDYSDARMLAELERVGFLPRVWLAPEPVRELRKLCHYRDQLVKERKNNKLRVTAILREHRVHAPAAAGGRWSRAWLAWLSAVEGVSEQSLWIIQRHLERLAALVREIRQVEARLAKLTAKDPLVRLLRKQPGIGPVTSWILRAVIGRFDRFRSGKQLCRYCALSPRNASSGQRQADAGLIKSGDKLLRPTLMEAGHRLIRCDPRWRKLAGAMRARGKKPSVIVAAVTNRWMRWLFHQVKEVNVNQT